MLVIEEFFFSLSLSNEVIDRMRQYSFFSSSLTATNMVSDIRGLHDFFSSSLPRVMRKEYVYYMVKMVLLPLFP